jgi:RecA-family ATPase
MTDELNQTHRQAVVAALQSEFEHFTLDTQNLEDSDDLFKIRSANTWLAEAATHKVPKMLFDRFWYEGELCIMFADSNLGKSILAVQIANSINRGVPIAPFEFEADAQPVLYYDFELTSKQLEARYSREFADHYIFRDDLYRGQLNDMELPDGFTNFNQYLNHALERSIVQTKAKVIVIDNITYLGTENEQAKDALPLMKHLKALKTKYDLSILVLAHTPKRDMTQAITRNDLQGSKMLMNFCDSSFAIGESQLNNSIRYLKQIKQRNTEQVYGAEKICLFNITKPHNFLQYEFLAFGQEWEHLSKRSEPLNQKLIDEAVTHKLDGKSLRETAAIMGIHYSKVDRLLKASSKTVD